MKLEEEIKIIAEKFGISELEIKKVIGYKRKKTPIKKRITKVIEESQIKKKKAPVAKIKLEQSMNIISRTDAFFFTKTGYDKLLRKIQKINDKIADLGKEIGKSCEEGAETFHDNFVYEEGNRQQQMWSQELKKFLSIKDKVKIISYRKLADNIVYIGRKVTIRDTDSKREDSFIIGGYMSFSPEEISYISPMAKAIMGAKEGDVREMTINKKTKKIKILKIE